MNTLVILAAAAAAEDWIPGKVIIALFSAIFAAGGGIYIGNRSGRKSAEQEAERRHVTGKVEAQIPQPCTVEQSSFQAHCKDNARDHADIFERLRRVESDVAGHTAAILALKEMQNKIYDMVQALYERIIVSKRK